MLDLEPLYRLVSLLPFECLQAGFMQQALVALILLAPMAATMGVQVVSFRMAFFSDAISHSAFAGVALGLIFSINPHVAMPVFGILVGLGIMAVQRNSALSSDTIIGVFFSAVMAFGLAVVSRDNAVARDLQQFLYGDILTITETDIRWLIGLFFALAAFQIWGLQPPVVHRPKLRGRQGPPHQRLFLAIPFRRAARACRDVSPSGPWASFW